MPTENAGIRVESILGCVPFSFVLDADGRIVRLGAYFAARFPEIAGKRYDAAFTVVQGEWALERLLDCTADTNNGVARQRIELEFPRAGALSLIGSALPLAEGAGGVMFIGTIAPSMIANVTDLGLTISDFAPFDVAPDLAMMAQVNEAVLRDTRLLNERLATARDEAVAAQKSVEAIALVDSLSGLGNRAAYQMTVDEAASSDTPRPRPSSLLLVDLDNFKPVNDYYGHAAGDEVIRTIGGAIRGAVIEGARAYRLGGDEFAVLFRGATPHQAIRNANEILHAINRTFLIGDRRITISASGGLASRMFGINDIEGLYRAADIALHDAKRSGRAKLQTFTAGLGRRELENKLLERDLFEAVDTDDLEIWVQPQFDLQSGALWGGEALVRWWNRRLERYVPPAVFVPIAEQYGFIPKIDLFVFAKTVAQRRIIGGKACKIAWSTNFSPLTIQQRDLRQNLRAILEEQGPLCAPLTIEITENAISDAERIGMTLRGIRDMGMEVAIDDFGAGQTSLSQLTQLPITRLKLDRSLVEKVDNDERSEMIARSIVQLAHELGLRVTAEGIERQSQAERLSPMGPMKAQGFLYARPMPLADFAEYIDANAVDEWQAAAS